MSSDTTTPEKSAAGVPSGDTPSFTDDPEPDPEAVKLAVARFSDGPMSRDESTALETGVSRIAKTAAELLRAAKSDPEKHTTAVAQVIRMVEEQWVSQWLTITADPEKADEMAKDWSIRPLILERNQELMWTYGEKFREQLLAYIHAQDGNPAKRLAVVYCFSEQLNLISRIAPDQADTIISWLQAADFTGACSGAGTDQVKHLSKKFAIDCANYIGSYQNRAIASYNPNQIRGFLPIFETEEMLMKAYSDCQTRTGEKIDPLLLPEMQKRNQGFRQAIALVDAIPDSVSKAFGAEAIAGDAGIGVIVIKLREKSALLAVKELKQVSAWLSTDAARRVRDICAKATDSQLFVQLTNYIDCVNTLSRLGDIPKNSSELNHFIRDMQYLYEKVEKIAWLSSVRTPLGRLYGWAKDLKELVYSVEVYISEAKGDAAGLTTDLAQIKRLYGTAGLSNIEGNLNACVDLRRQIVEEIGSRPFAEVWKQRTVLKSRFHGDPLFRTLWAQRLTDELFNPHSDIPINLLSKELKPLVPKGDVEAYIAHLTEERLNIARAEMQRSLERNNIAETRRAVETLLELSKLSGLEADARIRIIKGINKSVETMFAKPGLSGGTVDLPSRLELIRLWGAFTPEAQAQIHAWFTAGKYPEGRLDEYAFARLPQWLTLDHDAAAQSITAEYSDVGSLTTLAEALGVMMELHQTPGDQYDRVLGDIEEIMRGHAASLIDREERHLLRAKRYKDLVAFWENTSKLTASGLVGSEQNYYSQYLAYANQMVPALDLLEKRDTQGFITAVNVIADQKIHGVKIAELPVIKQVIATTHVCTDTERVLQSVHTLRALLTANGKDAISLSAFIQAHREASAEVVRILSQARSIDQWAGSQHSTLHVASYVEEALLPSGLVEKKGGSISFISPEQAANTFLDAHVIELRTSSGSLQIQVETLSAQITGQTEAKGEKESSLRALQEENERLSAVIAAGRGSADTLKQAQTKVTAEIAELKIEIARHDSEAERLRKEHETALAHHRQQIVRLEQIKAQTAGVEAEITYVRSLEARRDKAVAEHTVLQEEVERLERKLEELRRRKDEGISERDRLKTDEQLEKLLQIAVLDGTLRSGLDKIIIGAINEIFSADSARALQITASYSVALGELSILMRNPSLTGIRQADVRPIILKVLENLPSEVQNTVLRALLQSDQADIYTFLLKGTDVPRKKFRLAGRDSAA